MGNKKRVAIIDYQMGNLFSVKHACSYVGLEPVITTDKKVIRDADAAILPGVGAFGQAMENLVFLDLVESIHEYVNSGRPFMGICLGLQLLFSESEEFGNHQGLDIIPGKVIRFPNQTSEGKPCKVPQMGWNAIAMPPNGSWDRSPLSLIKPETCMYFVHSYYVLPELQSDILSLTSYEGTEYCSAILRNNVFATQYHPEKSGLEGIKIYQNWANNILKKEST
jgi:imidazole glycerol-phosphate synthase subunit HisH